eukprot:6201298-Pleurochrysis_carterae.AAC.3
MPIGSDRELRTRACRRAGNVGALLGDRDDKSDGAESGHRLSSGSFRMRCSKRRGSASQVRGEGYVRTHACSRGARRHNVCVRLLQAQARARATVAAAPSPCCRTRKAVDCARSWSACRRGCGYHCRPTAPPAPHIRTLAASRPNMTLPLHRRRLQWYS